MSMVSRSVLGMRVDAPTTEDASRTVLDWASEGRSAYVCASNVHMTMETFDSEEFRSSVNGADLVVPDGKPLVWALNLLGVKNAEQVRGADLMAHTIEQAVEEGVPVGFYGSTPESLEDLIQVLEQRYPKLQIACRISPPFRPLSDKEDEGFVRQISDSGARILFVGLGCPKQEKWMESHKGRIPAVMLGVGAAFDFHTGRIREAPRWMSATGLEWAYRFYKEPRRLWKRYLKHNPRFVAMFVSQALGLRKFDEGGSLRG